MSFSLHYVRKHPAELAGPVILVFGRSGGGRGLTRRSVRPKIVWEGTVRLAVLPASGWQPWQAKYSTVKRIRG